MSFATWQRSRQGWQKVWKQGSTLGETKVPLQTGHLVLELVKLPPPRGEDERPAGGSIKHDTKENCEGGD